MNDAPVYVVDGARTPFLKARKGPGPWAAADLAVQAGRSLLLRQPFDPADLDEVVLGCAAPAADEANIARVVALRLGCGPRVPAWTVMRNCASGMQALDCGMSAIRLGRADLVLAGGTDALSRAPVLLSDGMVRWLARWTASRGLRGRLAALAAFRPRDLAPVIGLLKGLTDPVAGVSMGQTAEHLATRFGVDRAAMDAYSAQSHRRARAAQDAGRLDAELAPLVGPDGTLHLRDDGVRDDATPERLARLRPAFDLPWGRVTAGNSSQVTDGAALLLLASEAAVRRWNLQPLGCLVDSHWAALDPIDMGLGPVHAATPLLRRHGLALHDPDLWEINEAFAAQLLACLAAWRDPDYCRAELDGMPAGTLDPARLNVDGGAIALGHPVGASGARLVLHLLHALRQRGLRRGMAALCIGGGQGGAMLVEAQPASPPGGPAGQPSREPSRADGRKTE